MDEIIYFTFDELQDAFDCTVEQIDSSYIINQDDNGVTLKLTDINDNGVPDFYDAICGIDITLKPSEEMFFG